MIECEDCLWEYSCDWDKDHCVNEEEEDEEQREVR